MIVGKNNMKTLAPSVVTTKTVADPGTFRKLVFPLLPPRRDAFWAIIYTNGQQMDIYTYGYFGNRRDANAFL